MKISYRNYPILEKLHKGTLGNMPILEIDKAYFNLFGELFSKNWKLNVLNFQHEINLISKPFHEASFKAGEKLTDLWKDILINDISDFNVKGCYLDRDYVYMINYEVKKGSESQEIAFYVFDKKGIPLLFYVDSVINKIYQQGWISSYFSLDNNSNEAEQWIFSMLTKIVVYKLFKSYAEVETLILPPTSKVKNIDCKYANDTNFKINYLDSKWFTNLVKSDSFNVRGHFRLQPKKKDGEWTKEIIWISEFTKTGYNAPARKI